MIRTFYRGHVCILAAFLTMVGKGKPREGRSEKEVVDILDTFMMVYAVGLNLDASMLQTSA